MKMLRNFSLILLNLIFAFEIGVCFQFQRESGNNGLYDMSKHESKIMKRQNLRVETCVCVPPGSCKGTVYPPTDGGGVFDIRIVNKPSNPPKPPQPKKCKYGLDLCCYEGSYKCGMRYPPVQGSPSAGDGQAKFGEFPWQIVILGTDSAYLGSGVLIGERHVLTVAHKINKLSPNSIKILLGDWNADTIDEPIPSQESSVSKISIHPNFNENNLQNDVAIITLGDNINLGDVPTIATACLPNKSFVGQKCYVSGWGKNDFGASGQYQSILRSVDLQIQSADFCQESLRKTKLTQQFIFNSESFICAGGEEGKDACTGDGGSPLVCEMNDQWYVVGLVAWGIGCATGGVPGVYVNVLSYNSWIQSTMSSS